MTNQKKRKNKIVRKEAYVESIYDKDVKNLNLQELKSLEQEIKNEVNKMEIELIKKTQEVRSSARELYIYERNHRIINTRKLQIDTELEKANDRWETAAEMLDVVLRCNPETNNYCHNRTCPNYVKATDFCEGAEYHSENKKNKNGIRKK